MSDVLSYALDNDHHWYIILTDEIKILWGHQRFTD
jgi:hypothetical protein